ncbi:MAG: hypothetical protein GX310_03845 [Synergistaceae bacterium]|nr:hypothetical protein [Synergistaceae bacterium]
MKKLVALFGLILALVLPLTTVSPALAEDGPSLEIPAAVMERLEALGTVFNLDWGLYRNT